MGVTRGSDYEENHMNPKSPDTDMAKSEIFPSGSPSGSQESGSDSDTAKCEMLPSGHDQCRSRKRRRTSLSAVADDALVPGGPSKHNSELSYGTRSVTSSRRQRKVSSSSSSTVRTTTRSCTSVNSGSSQTMNSNKGQVFKKRLTPLRTEAKDQKRRESSVSTRSKQTLAHVAAKVKSKVMKLDIKDRPTSDSVDPKSITSQTCTDLAVSTGTSEWSTQRNVLNPFDWMHVNRTETEMQLLCPHLCWKDGTLFGSQGTENHPLVRYEAVLAAARPQCEPEIWTYDRIQRHTKQYKCERNRAAFKETEPNEQTLPVLPTGVIPNGWDDIGRPWAYMDLPSDHPIGIPSALDPPASRITLAVLVKFLSEPYFYPTREILGQAGRFGAWYRKKSKLRLSETGQMVDGPLSAYQLGIPPTY